jgi:photosystem II stability/assembly factor-like uncharacterized protein
MQSCAIAVLSKSSRTVLLALVLVSALVGPESAWVHAVGRWASIGPPGGRVLSLAVDPLNPSLIYAGLEGGGVFRSPDGGDSWSRITTGLPPYSMPVEALAIDPRTPSTLYAAIRSGPVYCSKNRGDTWTPISNGLWRGYWNPDLGGPPDYVHVVALVIDPLTPSTLYAGTEYSGVFRSADGGKSWTPLNDSSQEVEMVTALAIDPVTPSTLYAGTFTGNVFRSTDSGDNWFPASEGLPDTWRAVALVIDPQSPSTLYVSFPNEGVFRSTDAGDSWAPSSNGLPAEYPNVMDLAIDPITPSTLYAATNGWGAYRTTDAGVSWMPISGGLPDPRIPVHQLAIDTMNPSTLYLGSADGVFRSTNGGDSWTMICSGLSGHIIWPLAIDPLNPSTLYAGTTGAGLLRTTDAGHSWTHFYGRQVSTLAIDPVTPSTLYAGLGISGVSRTTNSGESWTPASDGLPEYEYVTKLAIDPQRPSTLYAAMRSSGMFRTTDAADSWTAINDGLLVPDCSSRVAALAIDPERPSTVYAATENCVFRSTDSGDHWTTLHNGLPDSAYWNWVRLAIDPLTPSTLFAGLGLDGVFRSIDGGDNWTAINRGLPRGDVNLLAIDPLSPSTLYAGLYSAGIFRSIDGGETWTSMNEGLTETHVFALAIDALNPSNLYVGTSGGGVFAYRPELQPSFFSQIADGTVGSLQFQSTLILVNTGPDTPVRVEFFRTPEGAPMALTLGELGTDSVFELELKRGKSVSLPTPGTGEIQVGYARVSASPDVGGVVVFRRADRITGVTLYEAGVPASRGIQEFSLFVDSLGMRDTGVALLYPPTDQAAAASETPAANLTIHLHDLQYSSVGERTLEPLAPGGHLARYVNELFDDPEVKAQAREMQGILQVESDQPLVAVTLRQNDDPTKEFPQDVPSLTTFPVVAGVPEGSSSWESGSSSFFFPQFGNGAVGNLQFQSTLILVNTGPAGPVRVELYGTPDGAPMAVTLGELGTDSVFEFDLDEGQSIALSTPGTGELQVGYVRISGGAGVGGVVVFQRTDLASGILLYEAGVPASEPLSEFSIFVDSLGARDTGFALVYPPHATGSAGTGPDARVSVRLYDKQYQLIAEKDLDPLAPGSHLARFVYETFDDAAVKIQAREMEGILVITSDQPLAAVTVRQNDDPALEFPEEVPLLTTFPVIPGAPD